MEKNTLGNVRDHKKEGYDGNHSVIVPGLLLRMVALLCLITAGLYGLDRIILFAGVPHSGIYGSFHAEGYLIRSLDDVNASPPLQRGTYVKTVEGVSVSELFGSLLKTSPDRMPEWRLDRPLALTLRDEAARNESALLRLRPFSLKDLAGPFRIWFLGAFILLCGSYLLYRYPRQSRVNVLSILLFATALSIFNYSGRHLTLDLNPRLPLMLVVRMATISAVFSSWLYLIILFLQKRGRFRSASVTIWIIYLFPILIAVVSLLLHENRLEGYGQAMRLLYLWAGGAITLSFLILLQGFRRAKDPVLKAQLKWVLWGHILGMSPYILFYALPTAFTGIPVISYGAALAPFPIIVFAYLFSFYRYRLMDVDEVIHSSVVYGVSAGLLIILYLTGIGLFHRVIQLSTGEQFGTRTDLFFLLALAFVFNPLKNLVRKWIDRALFPERNELPGILFEGSARIARVSNLSQILDFLLLEFPSRFGIASAAVALRSPGGEEWEMRMRPEGWIDWGPEMKSALEILVQKPPSLEEWERFSVERDHPDRSLIAFAKAKGVHSVFPLKSGNDLLGLYLLGERPTHRLLNSEEARLIATISTQAAHRVGNARLLETLQKANRSLVDLSSRLMQTEQMANLGEGAAVLAHELKTPLGIIRGSAEILDRARDPTKNGEVVRFIMEEADRLAGIVDDFIQFARIPPPSKTATDLNDLVQSAALLWESRRKIKRDILLYFRLSPAVGSVELDSKQIYQVLLNLFSNAEEAMPKGGEIVVSTEVDDPSDRVRILVQDTGKGIPEQNLARVFDRFFTTKESGLGLGLALVRKIMEAHGGAVQIASSLEKGTEIILTLPRGVNPVDKRETER